MLPAPRPRPLISRAIANIRSPGLTSLAIVFLNAVTASPVKAATRRLAQFSRWNQSQ